MVDLYQDRISILCKILHGLLSNPTKHNMIEYQMIQRLRLIDKEGIFIVELYLTLLKCEDIQTLHMNSKGVQFYGPFSENQIEIPKEQYKKSLPIVQNELANVIISGIVNPLINNLYNINNQSLVIKMIDQLIYLSMNEKFDEYDLFFRQIIQTIFSSRRYLIALTASQIIQSYAFSIGPSTYPNIISFKTIGKKENQKEQCKFILDGQEYFCDYLNETEKESSVIIEISKPNDRPIRFFLNPLHPPNKYQDIMINSEPSRNYK